MFKARVSCLLAAENFQKEHEGYGLSFVFKIYFCHIVHVMLELLLDRTSCQETSEELNMTSKHPTKG